MPNIDLCQDVAVSKDAWRVKRSCESINTTEAEEHNSFDHSKASTTTCDYRTQRQKPFGNFTQPGPQVLDLTSLNLLCFDKLKKKKQQTSRKESMYI